MVKVFFITASQSFINSQVSDYLERLQNKGGVDIIDIKHSSCLRQNDLRHNEDLNITVSITYKDKK